MKPNYDRWRKRLAGEIVTAFTEPDESDVGFYRLPIREKQPNGRWKLLGYKPVALFIVNDRITGSELVARIGDQNATLDHLNEQWPWFVKHPVSEEWWRAVAEKGEPWPDFPPSDTVPATDREVTKDDNVPDEPLDVQHAAAIDNAISVALKTVSSEAQAAQALGSKNRIAELRLAADKAGKAVYEPLYRVYSEEQKKWSPIIKRAEAKEKELNTAILTFREKERRRIAAEQAESDRKQREIDEANTRAADRAIARGEPEPMPIIEDLPTPAVLAPVTPTYGTRQIKEELHTILESITDYDAVYAFLKDEPKVRAILLELAATKVKAGFSVPGTKTRQGLI